MTDWVVLLAASLLLGAAVVGAMALPRPAWAVALLTAVAALVTAVSATAAVMTRYATVEAAFAGVFFLFAGIIGGYRLTAAALPHLASRPAPRPLPAPHDDGDALVLVCSTDTERYVMRAVARRHDRLTNGAGIDVPPTAVPFVFLAHKTRYRAVRGAAHGMAIARSLATRVEADLRAAGRDVPVALALADDPGALTETVAEAVGKGARRVAIVVLGAEDSDEIDQAKATLDAARTGSGIRVAFGGALWQDCLLADRLAERILAATSGVDPAEVGVVLVSAGLPPEWEASHRTGRSDENFFNQRVRMTLAEGGIDTRAVRIAWLDWQLPDVTEAVRHAAALGKTRIIVAPATMVLPTLESTLDFERAIEGARLPATVHVVELGFWGDDVGLVSAVTRSASTALDALSRERD